MTTFNPDEKAPVAGGAGELNAPLSLWEGTFTKKRMPLYSAAAFKDGKGWMASGLLLCLF